MACKDVVREVCDDFLKLRTLPHSDELRSHKRRAERNPGGLRMKQITIENEQTTEVKIKVILGSFTFRRPPFVEEPATWQGQSSGVPSWLWGRKQ